MQASLTRKPSAFFFEIMGQPAFSAAFRTFLGGFFSVLAMLRISRPISLASFSLRFWACFGVIGGIIRVCGKSQMQEH